MTLYELGIQYEQTADMCSKRAKDLYKRRDSGLYMDRYYIQRKANMALEMARDARKIANYLKHYRGENVDMEHV